ncbi:hypothetical protein LKM2_3401 [Leptospira kirschneri serovar Mozdok]|nr:hypothetical protein [Leptospira kirschneri serovar Mozdok]
MREKPLLCGPLDSSPKILSPVRIVEPSIIESFSTAPTTKPARSNSSSFIVPGCSAVSPPNKDVLDILHPCTIPATI